jgi:hypothetical protein
LFSVFVVPASRPFDIVGPIARDIFVAAQIAGLSGWLKPPPAPDQAP